MIETLGRSAGQNADGAHASARITNKLVTYCARRLLRWAPQGSLLVELPDGERVRFGRYCGGQEAFIKLNNYRAIFRGLQHGSIGFAEAYMSGDIECPNLVALFEFFIRNRDRLVRSGGSLFDVRFGDRLDHFRRRNTKQGSRRNISDHYDLGNRFYELWLDEQMNYSSGFYGSGAKTLENAQSAKLHMIIDWLNLSGGENILEIGCGWGAFARKVAGRYDATVTGITLSHEQLARATEKNNAGTAPERCEFRLQDYRDVQGLYDRVVSIEMIEAVGARNWQLYFHRVRDLLKSGGTAVIQAITIDKAYYDTYRRNPDFIQRYIFPGGMLPTPAILTHCAEQAGLVLRDEKCFGACYAQTLRDWRVRFERAWPSIHRLGFDEVFRRKWRYYLTYCEAGFDNDMIDVGLYRFEKK